jgi:ATP-binding cassette subfamily B protein
MKNLKHIHKTHVLQLDQSDCGVACLHSLIKYYHGASSFEYLRKLSGTSKQGTTLLGLYQAAQELGFDAQGNEADINALIEHNEPLILHIIIEGKLQHYVICYGYNGKTFTIGDPGKGIFEYTKEQLDNVWKSKTCLTLKPNKSFQKKSKLKKSKRDWFLKVIKEDYRVISFSLILGLAISILGMTMAVFSQKLIDEILPSNDIDKLIAGIVLVGFLLCIRIGFNALRDFFLIHQTKEFNTRILDKFYTSLLHLPKSFFNSRKIGDLVARLNDTQRVQRVINRIVGNVLIDILVTISSLGLIFIYSWQSGIIVVLSLPLYAILIYRFNKPIITSQKEVMQAYALNESNYINSMNGIATIKNNNKQTVFQSINNTIYGNFQSKVFDLGKINLKLSAYSGLFSNFFLIGILAYCSLSVYRDELQLGELMAILGVSGSLLPAVANLALISIAINEAKVAFNRMFEFASITPENSGSHKLKNFERIDLKNIAFRFPGHSLLFQKLSLSVKRGECHVLVGESGSGKSTIAEILQKSYELSEGKITVNSTFELKDIDIYSWRKLIAVVPQEVTLFNGNLLTNIVLGDLAIHEEFDEFCQYYGFDKFIGQLPQGLATIVGEEGINLSGGQKQIVGLMRALYKNPQFLILDEFTSAMDRVTESFAMECISKIKADIGVFFITHRLSIVPRIADKISVLENNSVTLTDSHLELLKHENFYSRYWNDLFKFRK